MRANSVLVACAILSPIVDAIPLINRNVVQVTSVVEDVVTIAVTQTVFVGASTTYTKYSAGSQTVVAQVGNTIVTTTTAAAVPTSVPETSSVYVPPPPPASTSSNVVATTSAVTASNNQAGSGLSGGMAASGTSYTGEITYYETGMGACGWSNAASENIAAISHVIFDSYATAGGNSNNNPICGKMISITGKDGSRYQAKVVDRCVSCVAADLDLSQSLFNTVTHTGDGRVPGMTWSFL